MVLSIGLFFDVSATLSSSHRSFRASQSRSVNARYRMLRRHRSSDLTENFFENECSEKAHEVLRLSFHDAIAFSQSKGPSAGGGADGSMLFPDVEPNYAANNGIMDIVEELAPFLSSGKYASITAGDMI
ncbi:hypothetical protein D9757_000447 [Collybiopsis confluens]|uniref:Plant heme peroxidase family profile domain-containing protein n=1 Tax=Collybiopsis confluens TaxID=2823264 RepID=A0A8H5I1F2_9AGAR|nr:hypothetical protein D9757_000447 [Collybiopsis confluens]